MKAQRYLWAPVLVVATLIALMVVGGCGSGNGSGGYGNGLGVASVSPTDQTTAVSIKDFSFTPAQLTVKVGTAVTWTNDDRASHTVTSTDGPDTDAKVTNTFDSGDMAQGDTFSFTFEKAGVYYYECTIHATMASMHAEVVVR